MPKTKEIKSTSRAHKPARKETVLIQCNGGQWDVAELKEKAIVDYVQKGHQRGRIRKLAVYIKPEERRVYYVVNEQIFDFVGFE